MVRQFATEGRQPAVIDADGLNALAGFEWHANGRVRVLTPHPGEMSRLAGTSTAEVQKNRISTAQTYSQKTASIVVLKGARTVIALPDGRVWINPTGSPSMAKAGTGDILTGMVAGMIGQNPHDVEQAVIAAVYLHGLAGELGAKHYTDRCLLATEILDFLPEALRACSPDLSHQY
jgi:NAD(P)H-hydrate epimerase